MKTVLTLLLLATIGLCACGGALDDREPLPIPQRVNEGVYVKSVLVFNESDRLHPYVRVRIVNASPEELMIHVKCLFDYLPTYKVDTVEDSILKMKAWETRRVPIFYTHSKWPVRAKCSVKRYKGVEVEVGTNADRPEARRRD